MVFTSLHAADELSADQARPSGPATRNRSPWRLTTAPDDVNVTSTSALPSAPRISTDSPSAWRLRTIARPEGIRPCTSLRPRASVFRRSVIPFRRSYEARRSCSPRRRSDSPRRRSGPSHVLDAEPRRSPGPFRRSSGHLLLGPEYFLTEIRIVSPWTAIGFVLRVISSDKARPVWVWFHFGAGCL